MKSLGELIGPWSPGERDAAAVPVTAGDILAEWHENTNDMASPHLNRAAAALHAGDRAKAAGELELAADCHGDDSETGERLCRMAMSLARESGSPLNLTGDAWRHELRDSHGEWTRGGHFPGSAVPQEMYHGTPSAARADSILAHGFSESRLGESSGNRGWAGEGTYLTERPEYAATYGIAGDDGKVIRARVNTRNPWDSSMAARTPDDIWSFQNQYRAQHPSASQDELSAAISDEARRRGHDSIIQRGKDGKINEMVVFDPHNVVATGSRPAMDVALEGSQP